MNLEFMQVNALCIDPQSAKHILDIRGTSHFECPYTRGSKYHGAEL